VHRHREEGPNFVWLGNIVVVHKHEILRLRRRE
jgi:hypothetical protein